MSHSRKSLIMIVCVVGLGLTGVVIACVCLYMCVHVLEEAWGTFCYKEYCCVSRWNEYDSLCVNWCISNTDATGKMSPLLKQRADSPQMRFTVLTRLCLPLLFSPSSSQLCVRFFNQTIKSAHFKDSTTADSHSPQAIICFYTHLSLINKRLTIHL